MTTTYTQSSPAFNDLAALLTGQLILPEDTAYESVRQLWNGKVKTRPAEIARCLTVQDVIHTVRWTRAQGLPSRFEVEDTILPDELCLMAFGHLALQHNN